MEALLRHERAIVVSALAVLALLGWTYVWQGAGLGMSALQMTTITLFPHLQHDPMAGMPSPVAGWITVAGMWWSMMIAMMTPSTAALLLLYGRVLRRTVLQPVHAAPIALAAGHLVMWLAFSLAAAGIQLVLQRTGLISSMMLWSRSAALSAVLLFGAGLYQLSPFKYACLQRCRGPVQFLTQHWRPGRAGPFLMGIRHGAWCVGCCWTLMVLLFVGGAMNLAWIAVLSVLVLAEKVAPCGVAIGRIVGGLLILWSVATALA